MNGNNENPAEAAASLSHSTAGGAYAVLGNRDFLLYLIGRFTASLGQQMFVMAIGWEIYERTHSALALAYIGLTQIIPMFLLTLPAGHVADSYERKKIIIVTTLVVMVANIGLTVLSAQQAPIPWFYVCLVITGAARTFLWAASAAFLPHLVDRKDLSKAVNWGASAFQSSCIIGPILAGQIIGWTHQRAASVYAFNAVASLALCILLGMVRRQHRVASREKMTLKTLLTGFHFVFESRIILGIISLDMFAVLLGGCTALLPIYAKDILKTGPGGLGLLQAALPLGAVFCSFILAHRPPLQKAGRDLLWAVAAFGLATIGFGFSRWFWFSFATLFASGAVDNISVVVRQTLVQLLTPDDKRGRVSAVNNLFIGTSNELGTFESGFVAHIFGKWMGNSNAFGSVVSAVSGGVGTIVVVLAVAWIWPEIRKYGKLDG